MKVRLLVKALAEVLEIDRREGLVLSALGVCFTGFDVPTLALQLVDKQ